MRLPPPSPALRASVVLPARNEEDLIRRSLLALAAQSGVPRDQYEILLVLDRCTDYTERHAREVLASNPDLRLRFLEGPGKGSGPARRLGMEAACERLLEVGRPDGLIASTDADTVVAPDWLSVQLEAVAAGARAIGGRIDLAGDDVLPTHVRDWHEDHSRARYRKLLSEPDLRGRTEHWQFSGASLAVTAQTYREVGGLEPLIALEDEHLEGVLRRRGIPIERLLAVRVTTSPRLEGRAERGLSYDLSRVANGNRRPTVADERQQ
jgi:glucosyl-3-phosphoglycerate synthase